VQSHTLPSVKTSQFVTVQSVRSTYRWAVTGTPFTSSVKELEAQAEFVGHWRGGAHLASWVARFESSRGPGTMGDLCANLRRVMIRHTKEQQIAGGAALALPAQGITTHLLDMSAAERAEYDQAVAYEDARLEELSRTGAKARTLQQALRTRLQLCAHVPPVVEAAGGPPTRRPDECTKLLALREQLREKRRREPRAHAVVFTQHMETHAMIVRLLRADGFAVLAFSGATSGHRRHECIRSFQKALDSGAAAAAAAEEEEDVVEEEEEEDSGKAKVFVITLSAGAVGITLTAADSVFLMEPCLDPATELQAAGRVHRLGQSRSITVHRFVFRNTVEQSVGELHDKIKAGAITVANNFFTAPAVKLLASK
jgi:SNF2 family DNA or RNA helicase